MRVAVVAPSVFAINSKMDYGGSEVVIWNLVNELGKMDDIEYTLFAPKGSEAPGGELVETIEPPREFGREELDSLDKISHWMREFDVINDHTHQGWLLRMDRCGQEAWGFANTPIVKVFHGLQTWKELPPRVPTAYVVLSQFHTKDCFGKYPEFANYPKHIIPHGIDLEKYALEPDKDDYYFHPGLIAPHKGHTITLHLAKVFQDIHFIIGGEDKFIPDPNYRDWLVQDCMKLDNVDYLGSLKDSDKIELLQKAKAVLLPFQIGEAFSLLAIESLACGTPVITSNLGSMPEIIQQGKTGYMYRDANQFIVSDHPKMTYFLANIEAGRMLDPEECRMDALKRFDRRLMAERYVEVFREVLDEVPRVAR